MTARSIGSAVAYPGGPSGAYGDSLFFNGNAYVEVADAPSLDVSTQMSITAWVNTDPANDQDYVAWKVSSYSLRVINEAIGLTLWGVTTAGTTFAVANSEWHHIAYTYDGANIRGYLDGVLKTTVAATGNIAVTTNALRIGWRNTGIHYQGMMDNVRVYDTALDLSAVVLDKNSASSLPVPEPASLALLGLGGLMMLKRRR